MNRASTPVSPNARERRPVEHLLGGFDELAARSSRVLNRAHRQLENRGDHYAISRYLFLGPPGGGEIVRIGIFATIHGDEPEGALGMIRLVEELESAPEIASGYALYLYPLCNPTGYEDNTRHSRSGKDLNREFWRGSFEPEIRYLESEICLHAFDGIITLHSDDTSDGLYGFVSGDVLTEHLLEPALREAEKFLPRNRRTVIDGFSARHGIITDGYSGVLQSLPGLRHPPFEITFETPQHAPLDRQVEAFKAALKTILVQYRSLMAVGQNI